MSGSYSEGTSKLHTNRRQYLITYSKADLVKFPTRESFCDALISCFNATGKVVAENWACCLEEHEDTSGYHCHACVRLSGPKRWDPVKRRLHEMFGIQVNFSESHENYYSAYKYVYKNDPDVYKSANHPDLQELGSPTTKKCMSAYRQKCGKRKLDKNREITVSQLNGLNTINGSQMQNASQSKVRRLSNLDVSKFLVRNNIKNENDLFVIATEQQKAGKEDLYTFLVNRSPKSLQDLIITTWKMQNAKASIARHNTPRMNIIREAAGVAECVEGCGGKWLKCALEVLRNNGLHPIEFAEAVRDLLVNGRRKHRNIFIVGPADCANLHSWLHGKIHSILFPTQLTTDILGWKLRMPK